MPGRAKLRGLVAATTVLTVIGSYAIAVVPQAAATPGPDSQTQALLSALSGAGGAASLFDGLTAVGAFGAAEPALTLVPSAPSALGATPVSDALAAVAGLASATTAGEVKDALTASALPLGDGRTATFASTLAGGTLHVDVTVSRQDVQTGIRLHSTSKPIDFSSAKGVLAQPTLHVAFDLLWDATNGARLAAGPLVAVDTTAALSSTLSDVDAALGILGVTLGTPPSGKNRWAVTSHLVGSVRDPNNDGFLTTGPAGEIGAPGAAAGLGTVTVANPGGGTLDGRLYIAPRTTTAITGLPGATIDVTATSADLAADPVADYADGALAPVAAFQRLAPFDLAQGVAQLAVTLDTAEHARPSDSLIDVDLPLVRGSLADLVPGNEALEQFLADHVTKSSVLGAPGQVDFASVQGFLEELSATHGPGGYAVSIESAAFLATDAAHPKLTFTVKVHRDAHAQPTDPLAPMLTAAADPALTYAGGSVTSTFDFGTTTQDFRASLKGRQINAGGSSAVIDHVAGKTITLDPVPLGIDPSAGSYWKHGTPAGVGYSIEAGDAKTGNVELADTLTSTGHLRGANSAYPQATTTAAYDVSLPLVLDLQPALTGSACVPLGGKACPYQVDSPDGSSHVVAELPARPDRIMLTRGTKILAGRSSLASPVDITAPVGFVPVHVTGTLALTTTSDNMSITTDGTGDVSLGDLINGIHADPNAALSGLATGTTLLSAHAALALDVVRAPTFFNTPAAPGSASIDASAPSTAAPTVGDPHGNLADLAVLDVAPPTATDPGKPSKLFDLLLADLGALDSTLTTPPTAGTLGTALPVLGTTLGQALAGQETHSGAKYTRTGTVLTLTDAARTFDPRLSVGRRVSIGGTQYVANGLHVVTKATPTSPATVEADALDLQAPTGDAAATPADGTPYSLIDDLSYGVDAMTAAPPSDLDQLIGGLESILGAGSHVTFEVDRTVAPPVLKLHVVWPRSYDTSNPLLQTLQLVGNGAVPLAGHQGSGEIPLHVTTGTDVTLLVPLTGSGVTDPTGGLLITPGSARTAHVTAALTGKSLDAVAGSLQVTASTAAAVKADLSSTSTSTGSTPLSLSAWTTALTTTLTGTSQTCGAVTGSVCASLPLTPAGAADSLGTVTVTLPTTPATLDPTIAGTDALAAALNASKLDVSSLGTGISGYLDNAKDGLDAAVAGGKVPLVGKDLQEGTDFLGKLKSAFTAALPAAKSVAFAKAGDVTDQLSAVINDPALKDIHVIEGPLGVAATCAAVLEKAAKPSASGTGAPDADATKNAAYTYAVLALADGKVGPLSDASTAVSNLKVATSGHSNSVAWASVPYATGYRLYRSTGSTFGLIKELSTTDFVDDFSITAGAAPVTSTTTTPPDLGRKPCAADAPALSVAAVTLSIKLGQGDVDGTTGACADNGDSKCLTAGIPIDLGLPGLSLHAQKSPDGSAVDGDKVTAKLGWTLDLAVTLDKSKGFLIETSSGPQPELRVGATISLPSAGMDVSVSFLKAHLAPNDPTIPELAAIFTVDLGCKATCTDGQLPIGSLLTGGGKLTPQLSGKIHLDEHFDTGFGAIGANSRDTSLPGISGDFRLLAGWTQGDPLGFGIEPGEGKFGFYDVKLDTGTFLNTALGPIAQDIVTTLKPVQPILDTISAPIPVLSDLSHLAGGEDVTLVTLATAFGSGSATVATVLKVIQTVKQLNATLQSVAAGDGIDIGSLDLKPETVKTTPATPDAADGLVKGLKAPGGGTSFPSAVGQLNNKIKKTNPSPDAALSDSEATPTAYGFTFPALKHPDQLLKLLVGQDVEIAHFDSGPLSFNFTFSQQFGPVYAPPPVLLTISGSAGVTFRIAAGFDTYGIRQAVERGKADVAILDSLYFVTKDDQGQLIPVVQFTGELAAGAEVSVAFLSVGVEGGLRLTVDFTWNDPNNDGKFRFSEFLSAALQNPICLFNVGGRLSLFLKIYVTIGFSPFDVSFDFTLADITLVDFSLKPDCTPPPPKLGGMKGDVLYLFAGKTNGSDAQRGAPWGLKTDDPETWIVRQSGTTVTVAALGITEDFNGVSSVVLDARDNNAKQRVIALFQGKEKNQQFTDPVVFFGGAAGDVVKTDTGPAYIDGGGGDDSITTGDRPLTSTAANKSLPALATAPAVIIAGNGGNDHITVGNAIDTVAGDGHLSGAPADRSVTPTSGADVTVNTVPPTGITLADSAATNAGDPGNDVLSVGLGGGNTYGGPGGDQIAVAQDSPVAATIADTTIRATYTDQGAHIFGGTGPDRISAGAGDDQVFTDDVPAGFDAAHPEASQDAVGPDDLLGPTEFNTVDTGIGNDLVVGANGADLVTAHSTTTQHALVLGLGGRDVLTGGDGADRLFGGRADDYVVAQPADVGINGPDALDVLGTPAHPVSVKPDSNAPTSKTLVGGGGSDRIYGGDGPSTIFGDHIAVACALVGPNRSDGPADDATVYTGDDADGPDLIRGGAGADTIQAGGGNDWVFAAGGPDTVCGMSGDDHLYAGEGADTVWGGVGADVVQGDDGNDHLYGNDGADSIYGNAGTDVLEGNAGRDTLFGGQDADTLIGGTSAAGRPDAGDVLYGDEGTDVLIGDNGDPTSANGPSYDLDATDPGLGGADTISGGAGNDAAYGGLGADVIDGNADNDHLEGGPAGDVVHGNDGADDLIGGSSQLAAAAITTGYPDSGDTLSGGPGDDVVLGDDGRITDATTVAGGDDVDQGRAMTVGRQAVRYDLGDGPTAGTSGPDLINGDAQSDVLYGQGGDDVIQGGAGDDFAEGDSGTDLIEGNAGDDDLVGGSSAPFGSSTGDATAGQLDGADLVYGGEGDDVVLGDNGVITRTTPFDARTFRVSTTAHVMARRKITAFDLRNGGSLLQPPTRQTFGNDQLSGGAGVDLVQGQDGNDVLTGEAGDDYAEGNGGDDAVYGDSLLSSVTTLLSSSAWPTRSLEPLGESDSPAGQDDLLGGSSIQGFRDGSDVVHGDGSADYALGDNGQVVRDIQDAANANITDTTALTPASYPLHNRVYARRYGPVPPTGAAFVRHGSSATASTRFCTATAATCEPSLAFGADALYGDDGDDTVYGQDGNDTINGGSGDDDLYGELGDDVITGGDGEDAVVGDRGGIVDSYQSGANAFTIDSSQVPKIHYDGLVSGSVTRQVDLLHDVNGDAFIGSASSAPMLHRGDLEGGNDQIRGGAGHDSLHGGFGDDLMNGDSGGDTVYGDDGADILWGGKGSDDPLNLADRGPGDSFVDYLFGGKGGDQGNAKKSTLGADILDWRPRGTYTADPTKQGPTTCSPSSIPADYIVNQKTLGTVDPCAWFAMTDLTTADTSGSQHHQGVDWIYGGWDRDVLQADLADNGPNQGDRLLDWNGAYNLYTHCNSAYGGFNDVRQHSPAMQSFLQRWAYSTGAGQAAADATTSGTSAYDELALVYPGSDNDHGAGAAFSGTPGHFDQPNACAP